MESYDARTAAEQAYFESGGTNTSGLLAELQAGLEANSGASQEAPKVSQEAPNAAQGLAQVSQEAAQTGADGKPLGQQPGENGGQSGQSGRDEKGRFVPVQALHEERERRRALESELGQFRERFARADERQKALNELLALDPSGSTKAAQDAPIDPEKDIFGAFKQAMGKISALEAALKQSDQRYTAQTEEQRVMSAYRDDAQAFAVKAPDFGAAYQHLLSVRNQELEALGVTDPSQRQQIMSQEERSIAAQAFQARRSPAETIYTLAKLRGFTGKQAHASNGQAQARAQSDAAKQLEAAQKGREANATLSGTGASGGGGLTVEQLAAMSDDEFERVYSKLSESDRRRLMGG